MLEFFCDGFLILLGGHTADFTLAIYLDVQLYGLNRAVSWLLCTVDIASWLSGFSSVVFRPEDERWIIDISQLSASQFKEMADEAAHSRNWSLLVVVFC